MRKIKKSLVALLLLVSVIFSFASCSFLDVLDGIFREDNDTPDNTIFNSSEFIDGGPGSTYSDTYEEIWIETYEEMLVIVEKMKANGTEVPQIPAFNCEEYGLDVKFMISLPKHFLNGLEEGQEFYDIKINNFSICCAVFFEEITIETLKLYDAGVIYNKCLTVTVESSRKSNVESPTNAEDVTIQPSDIDGIYSVKYNDKFQFQLKQGYIDFTVTEEQFEILKKTIVII